ncbi:energy transducer TonB [Flavobacterium endoglycinae]|nr:energy transducer TonB [Flavobacterium endoglycinae]
MKHKITISNRVLYSQKHYYKMFLLTLFIAIATTLFSCANKDVNKKKTDQIETVTNSDSTEHTRADESLTEENHTNHVISRPPSKIDRVKFVKPKENNNSKSEKELDSRSEKTKNSSTKVMIKATPNGEVPSQINAEFPGGIDQFHSFFMKEYKKPESVEYWKLNFTLAFAVEKNGKMSFLECSPAVKEPLEKEIIRILSLCPKWQPAELNGKKIRVQYSVPILLK